MEETIGPGRLPRTNDGGDEEDGGRNPVALQDRKCGRGDVSKAVIKRDTRGSRGQRLPTVESIEQLLEVNHRVMSCEVLHLAVEERRRHLTPVERSHRPVDNAVIIEDDEI